MQASLDEAVKDLAEGRFLEFDDQGLLAFGEQIKREGRIAMGLPGDKP